MAICKALGGSVRLTLCVAAAAATVFISTEGISAPSSARVAPSSNASNSAGEGAETEQAGAESETEAAAPAAAPKGEESKKSDQALAAQVKLGDVYMQLGEWDLAIKAYAKVAESGKEPIASEARRGLANALEAKEAGALGLRAHLPAPFNRWWPLDYVAYAVMIAVLYVLVFGVAWPVSRSILKRNSAKADWRVAISGTAKEPHRSMAFDEFIVTMRELREQNDASRGLTAVGKTGGRLFTPISLTDLVGPKLVVRGIDVSQLAKTLQVFRDYFSYRFEVRIDENGDFAYICARLRWGGLTDKIWQIPSISGDGKFDYREIGRQLAYSVFGDGLVRQ